MNDEGIISFGGGKTFVQFGAGISTQSRSGKIWLSRFGASYLDGTIFSNPGMVGDPTSIILIGGDQTCPEGAQKYTDPMGGVRFLGDNIGAETAAEVAALPLSVALFMGVAHGARICRPEDVQVGQLGSSLCPDPESIQIAGMVQANASELGSLYEGARLKVCNYAERDIPSHATETETTTGAPTCLAENDQGGVGAGFGVEDRAV